MSVTNHVSQHVELEITSVFDVLWSSAHRTQPFSRSTHYSYRITSVKVANVDKIVNVLDKIVKVMVNGVPLNSIVTAARYPEGVSRVVLLDPPLYTYTADIHLQPEAENWFRMVAALMKDNPSPETIVAQLRPRMPDVPDDQLNGMASMISGVASGAPETALRDEIWQGVDVPQALQQIKCPVLMIHGDWSSGAAVREEDVEFFKAHCPSATVVRLPGADHGLKMQEQPDILLQHIKAFAQPTYPSSL